MYGTDLDEDVRFYFYIELQRGLGLGSHSFFFLTGKVGRERERGLECGHCCVCSFSLRSCFPVASGGRGGGEPSEQGAGATGLQLLCISLHFQMASGSRLRRGGSSSNVGRSSGFRPRSPHFCKVVVAESLRRGKIEIPLKFVRKYGHDLLNQVVLKVPGNDEWLVAVEQAHGKLWLGEGWREFQDHYCLIQGSFLLFQLDNLIGFHVLIFDRTATEIDYPARNPRGVSSELTDKFIPSETKDDSDDSLAENHSDSEPKPEQRQCKRRRRPLKPSKQRRPRVPVEVDDSSSAFSLSTQSEYSANSLSTHLEYESDGSKPESRRLGGPQRQKGNHLPRGSASTFF
ncbi:uncharacterized protein LOC116207874 [Punica granatum]|uniref:Uncharacterized protein LOC116207874 n=1 Tax=Punica granatum TaxID=22663 RepID=A0A218XB77_PUNGR|nr:uncharacterized protein LOC116207874 [Punica granatum]OWM82193.1 hypothetical protein CDL15_Pgr001767 [Punica granatum]